MKIATGNLKRVAKWTNSGGRPKHKVGFFQPILAAAQLACRLLDYSDLPDQRVLKVTDDRVLSDAR
jgi:hypothetical protein